MEKYNNWKLKFYTIWAGQAVSLITSAILQMAIIFYLTEKTGSAIVLSMASLVGFLPYAVFGPAIGVLVDRHDRKKIMIGADLIIAAAGAVLAIVALYMELPIWMVMVVLFIRSIGTAFHTPALNAVTPLLVPEEQLTKCAGYSQSLQSISYIVSPAVAALLYSVWELNAIIAIDVLGAVIASITVAIVRIPKLGDQVQSLKPNFIREMKEGMAVLRQNKGLFALLLVGTLYMFVYMPINALYPLITIEMNIHNISNGYMIWQNDLSEINQVFRKLQNLNIELEQKQDLLAQEIRIKSNEANIQVRNDIYDQLTTELSKQLCLLEKLLPEEEHPGKGDKISLIGTYIKRFCNLQLTYQENQMIPNNDLRISLEDMAKCMRNIGLDVRLIFCPTKQLEPQCILYAMKRLEEILEESDFRLSAISICVSDDVYFEKKE